jgi:hypothetical protein
MRFTQQLLAAYALSVPVRFVGDYLKYKDDEELAESIRSKGLNFNLVIFLTSAAWPYFLASHAIDKIKRAKE